MAGRKSKFTEKLAERICESLTKGVTLNGAAATAAISVTTLNEWRRKKPAFAAQVTRAIGQSEEGLVEDARKGSDPRVAVMLLERRFRNGWSKGEHHKVEQNSTITTVSPAVLKAFSSVPESVRVARSHSVAAETPEKAE
tara:strand:- start:133 stop:552 length:420 start_codon:yes stop_codon:yes gene_type:complete